MVFAIGRLKDPASMGMWNLFGPYSLSTWLAVACMLMIQAAYTVLLARVEVAMRRRKCFDPQNVCACILGRVIAIISRPCGGYCVYSSLKVTALTSIRLQVSQCLLHKENRQRIGAL